MRLILKGLVLVGALMGAAQAIAADAQKPKGFSGVASFYDKNYKGRTASGEKYDSAKLTAAHRTLPFGTRLRVIGPGQRSVVVVVNDRGPFVKTRVLDLSYAAAQELHIVNRGLARVTAEVQPAVTATAVSNRPTP